MVATYKFIHVCMYVFFLDRTSYIKCIAYYTRKGERGLGMS